MGETSIKAMLEFIIPRLIRMLMEKQSLTEKEALTQLYSSELYRQLEREETKLWHLSVPTLYDLWVEEKEKSCYICNRFADTYERYMDTFFFMYKKDDDFRNRIKNSKGFCLHHFGDLCEASETRLNDKEKKEFYAAMFELMEKNMARLQEDVDWLVEKFDYRNKDADWKNSKDAVQRGMQKLKGGYPADPVYKMNK